MQLTISQPVIVQVVRGHVLDDWGGAYLCRFHNLFSFKWNYVDQTFYDGVIWLQITGETNRNTKKPKVFCDERGKICTATSACVCWTKGRKKPH